MADIWIIELIFREGVSKTLKDLENVIDDEEQVAIDFVGSNDLPLFFKWSVLKKDLKPKGWNQPIHKITSYAGICIILEK